MNIPEVDEDIREVSYEVESPDEVAFVIAARELGLEFHKRTRTSLSMCELDLVSNKKVERPAFLWPLVFETKNFLLLHFPSPK